MPQGGRSRRRSRRNVLCNCACHDMQIVIHPATRVCAELKDLHTDMCFADTTIGRPYSAIGAPRMLAAMRRLIGMCGRLITAEAGWFVQQNRLP